VRNAATRPAGPARNHEQPPEPFRRGQEIVDPAVAFVEQEIAPERHIAIHPRHQRRRQTQDSVDLAAPQPVFRDRGPAAAVAVDLALLERKALVRAAGIALHLFEL
jgi:hypothetical protein